MNTSDEASQAGKQLSALGASKGGRARSAKLSAKERSRIAQKAARTRWGKEEIQPEIIRGKGLFDDAATLAEAAAMLRAEADRLDQLAREGWELEQPAYDDYGFLIQVPALREDGAQ